MSSRDRAAPVHAPLVRSLSRWMRYRVALEALRRRICAARQLSGSLTLMALGVFGTLAHAAPQRAAVPGLLRLIPATPHPILFFGEYHGTQQAPAFFGDAVAELSALKPVLVILEQNQSEARDVSRYINGALSMSQVVESGEWLWASKAPTVREDGRHSIAMVKLLYRLRSLRESGRPIYIGGTNADKLPAHVSYNAEMARNILRQSNGFSGVTMVYTGSAHARQSAGQADSLLPRRRTVSITTVPQGRSSVHSLWICRAKGGGILCSDLRYQHSPGKTQRKPCGAFGVHRSSPRRFKETGFDAYACVGAAFTASPPATRSNAAAWGKYINY